MQKDILFRCLFASREALLFGFTCVEVISEGYNFPNSSFNVILISKHVIDADGGA